MPIGIVQEEGFRFEIEDSLVTLVYRGNVQNAPALEIDEVQISITELFLALLQTTVEIAEPSGDGVDATRAEVRWHVTGC